MVDHRATTYIGPLDDFAFTVDSRVQAEYLEALQDRNARYVDGDGERPPVVHPGVLLSHSNATRSPSFGGPNTGWIHARDDVRFAGRAHLGEALTVRWQVIGHERRFGRTISEVSGTMTGNDGREILRRTMWGVRATAGRPLPPPAGRPSRTVATGGAALTGSPKDVTPQRIRLFSGWLTKNIHNDDDVARGAGLAAPVASATQGMAYLCELMVDSFGEQWLDTGSCALTFRKPIYPGDVVVAQADFADDPSRTAVVVQLVNQLGILVTAGTARSSGRPAAAAREAS